MTTSAPPPQPRFDTFYRHDALTRLLFEYAAAYPKLVAVSSIGKSYEGRDIWVATLTNTETGADTDKPAFWADGNIHAAELTASTAVLYYLHQLATGLLLLRRRGMDALLQDRQTAMSGTNRREVDDRLKSC